MTTQILSVKASHVNKGTSIDSGELVQATRPGRLFRHPKLQMGSDPGVTTAYGGLSLVTGLVRFLRLDRALEVGLGLLKSHRPFTDADHVLTHAYNLYLGGTCIEDIGNLQGSEAVRRMLGTHRIPDPTTAGDYLRRFTPDGLRDLNAVIDQAQEAAWKRRHGRRKAPLALVDLDSHVHRVYGDQKEGADFSYKGYVAYHPLVISMAHTQECLRLINRPGNITSADGSAEQIQELTPMLTRHFKRVVFRGDSAFSRQDIYDACEENGHSFAFVSGEQKNYFDLAEAIPEKEWKTFLSRQERVSRETPIPKNKRRKRGKNRRRQLARLRKKRDLKLKKQWIAEIPYKPTRSKVEYRLIIRRQRIEEHSKTGRLFDLWRYRYVITNITDWSAEEVMDLTYHRCDQEKVIEQLQNGISAMRMPTGSFMANSAFLTIARLAHNLKSWVCQLALPKETVRWCWKRFRTSFVIIAAKVILRARQVQVRLEESHRFADAIHLAYARLQT